MDAPFENQPNRLPAEGPTDALAAARVERQRDLNSSLAGTAARPARNRPWLLAFSGLAALFCAGVVAQVFLAGLGLLVDTSFLAWHTTFVHLLEGLLLAMLVVGVIARAGARSLAPTIGLYLLVAAQYAFIHGLNGPFRALHAVNAFALFVVSWRVAQDAAGRGWYTPRPAASRNSRVDAVLGSAIVLVALASIAVAGTLSGDAAGPAGPGSASAGAADHSQEASGVVEGDGSAGFGATDQGPGAAVYAENCSGCHGERGQGRVGPPLAGNDALADSGFVVGRVARGEGIMPPFERSLSASEIEAVAQYVRSSFGNDY